MGIIEKMRLDGKNVLLLEAHVESENVLQPH